MLHRAVKGVCHCHSKSFGNILVTSIADSSSTSQYLDLILDSLLELMNWSCQSPDFNVIKQSWNLLIFTPKLHPNHVSENS